MTTLNDLVLKHVPRALWTEGMAAQRMLYMNAFEVVSRVGAHEDSDEYAVLLIPEPLLRIDGGSHIEPLLAAFGEACRRA